MSKNTNTPAAPAKKPASAPTNPPAMAAKGSRENPWTGKTAPEDEAARAGQWLQLGNERLVQFGPKGQAPKGNWRCTPNGDGGPGASRRFNAARLNLSPVEFVALVPSKVDDGTPGSPLYAENLKARQEKAATGLTLLQALMEKVKIDLPETEAKKVTRPRTPAEMTALLAECNGDFSAFAAKMAAIPQITEVIPATKGGKVSIAQLASQGAKSLPAGTMGILKKEAIAAFEAAFEVCQAL